MPWEAYGFIKAQDSQSAEETEDTTSIDDSFVESIEAREAEDASDDEMLANDPTKEATGNRFEQKIKTLWEGHEATGPVDELLADESENIAMEGEGDAPEDELPSLARADSRISVTLDEKTPGGIEILDFKFD
jgi:hypothetical protein